MPCLFSTYTLLWSTSSTALIVRTVWLQSGNNPHHKLSFHIFVCIYYLILKAGMNTDAPGNHSSDNQHLCHRPIGLLRQVTWQEVHVMGWVLSRSWWRVHLPISCVAGRVGRPFEPFQPDSLDPEPRTAIGGMDTLLDSPTPRYLPILHTFYTPELPPLQKKNPPPSILTDDRPWGKLFLSGPSVWNYCKNKKILLELPGYG